MENIIKSCVVEYDDYGKCKKIADIKALNLNQIELLKKQADELKANELSLKAKEKADREKIDAKIMSMFGRLAIIVAKLQFAELVECGICETNSDFEEDYQKFLLGADLSYSNAPKEFLSIIERLG